MTWLDRLRWITGDTRATVNQQRLALALFVALCFVSSQLALDLVVRSMTLLVTSVAPCPVP